MADEAASAVHLNFRSRCSFAAAMPCPTRFTCPTDPRKASSRLASFGSCPQGPARIVASMQTFLTFAVEGHRLAANLKDVSEVCDLFQRSMDAFVRFFGCEVTDPFVAFYKRCFCRAPSRHV